MKRSFLIQILILFVLIDQAAADPRKVLDKPLMFGPQYPLLFMSTTFEPDTAFLLEEGDFFFASSYTVLNSYVYSLNSDKNANPEGVASEFDDIDSDGYSVYFDGELDRRFFKLYWGYSDNIELQFTYRDFRFFKGDLDATIENFHKNLDIGNQGRENTDRNQLEIYIHDNEKKENVFVITEESSKFIQESMTLGFKLLIKETDTEAIALTASSNYADYYIERGINESTSDVELPEHRNFNDFNLSLRYSSLFENWSLHAAFSVSFVRDSLLEKSPDEIYYFFLGGNFFLSPNWSFILQTLEYSSPFPKDKSTIAADVREITAGLRWFLTENLAFEFGMTENQSQGPQNIDIAFFSNLMFYL